jgi:hypothetical protein
MGPEDLLSRLGPLTEFLGASPLTAAVAELEHALAGCDARDVALQLEKQGVSKHLLRAAFDARREFGRINDVIHAAAIAISLPHLLQPGEVLKRPSLAAGNDPSRPFDVESDKRIAEFKLSRWDGHDAGRKRQVFKDLVHLAAYDAGDRKAELYVLGIRPITFLTTTTSTAAWALNRMSDKTRLLFQQRFGSLETPIPAFVGGPAAHVQIIDLEKTLPEYFSLGP